MADAAGREFESLRDQIVQKMEAIRNHNKLLEETVIGQLGTPSDNKPFRVYL